MAPLRDGRVHMAWIACYAAYSINGVAALHTEIIKRDTLHDWYDIWPEKFNNKTNGVTQRRWVEALPENRKSANNGTVTVRLDLGSRPA